MMSYLMSNILAKMGRKAHKLTEDERNTFEQVVKLKKDVIDKILHFEKQMSQAETVKTLQLLL